MIFIILEIQSVIFLSRHDVTLVMAKQFFHKINIFFQVLFFIFLKFEVVKNA